MQTQCLPLTWIFRFDLNPRTAGGGDPPRVPSLAFTKKEKMTTQLKSFPCKYKEIEYRSKTEARVAEEVFDRYQINFLYETETYILDGELYSPDFYLPEIKTFIEVKGAADSDLSKPKKLLKTLQDQWLNTADVRYPDGKELYQWEWEQPFMVVSIFSDGTFKSVDEEGRSDLIFTRCLKCAAFFFMNTSALYCCKKCDEWGKHYGVVDIRYFNLFKNQRQYKHK